MKLKELLKNEFISGRKRIDWLFLWVWLLLQIIAIIVWFVTGQPDSIRLIISGLTWVISVVLCSQWKFSFYLFGYIQLLTYVFFFAIPNRLHGETIENAMYFVTMIYWMYIWFKNYRKDKNTESIEIKARKLKRRWWIVTIASFVLWTIWYRLFLDNVPMFGQMDSQPFMDSITSVPAYIGQILMVLWFREQRLFWLILDVFSVILAFRAWSWVMVAQFIFRCANCVYWYLKRSKSAVYEWYEKIEK